MNSLDSTTPAHRKWPHERSGIGTWARFPNDRVGEIYEAARSWKRSLAGIERPWLVWCTDEDWCLVQQQLVVGAGWTPVVGSDGTCPRPRLVDNAVFVEFNRELQLPVMWMHFPLEWVHLFCDRLAFWHSDLLPPKSVMKQIAEQFDSIRPNELIGVRDDPSLGRMIRRFVRGPRRWSYINARRWFELIGCTTAGACESQFRSGCGWWRLPQFHPNCTDRVRNANPHSEHGNGIWFWEKYFGGLTRELSVDVNPYHYNDQNRVGNRPVDDSQRGFDTTSVLFKASELQSNYDLNQLVATLEFEPSDFASLKKSQGSNDQLP